MKKEFKFDFDVYRSINELSEEDANLLKGAIEATKDAYAPYSKFYVGAKARLSNGEFVSGTNQENASFPAGTCAERSLLSVVGSLFPNEPIETMAVTYHNENGKSDHPISPCGICRQAMLEYESRVGHPIRIILGGEEGQVFVVDSVKKLLPFSFTAEDMK